MKVFSLYHKKTFVGAFPNMEDAISYAKRRYGDNEGWHCNIIEEYLSKSPIVDSSILKVNTEKNIDPVMNSMPPSWRKKWCTTTGACACLGCANISGGLTSKGYTHSDWMNWVSRNPQDYLDNSNHNWVI